MLLLSRIYRVLPVLWIGLFLTACGSVKDYGEAMTAFSEAAAAENLTTVGNIENDPAVGGVEAFYPSVKPAENPSVAYLRSLELLNKALGNPTDLAQEQLLAPAYVLRGMSHWKLADYAAAQRDAAEARRIFRETAQDAPRDKPLAYALDHLTVLDSIRGQMLTLLATQPEDEATAAQKDHYGELKAFYQAHATATGSDALSWHNALAGLDQTIEEQARTPQMKQYLRNVQMSALRNWVQLFDAMNSAGQRGAVFQSDAELAWIEKAETDLGERKAELFDQLAKSMQAEGGKESPVYRFWSNIM